MPSELKHYANYSGNSDKSNWMDFFQLFVLSTQEDGK